MSVAPSSFQNKIVVVTGGGSGIGKALCSKFALAGASVVVVDLKGALEVVKTLPFPSRHIAFKCNVAVPSSVNSMIESVKQRYGKVDVYCSNAGIVIPSNPKDDSCVKHAQAEWQKIFQVNVFSHVIALAALLRDWERGLGDGHFCVTASAAGLLTMVGDASYGVSKAAALSWCEHVAISHPTVHVHCLCPQAVDTPLVAASKEGNAAMMDGMLSPEHVADVTLRGIQQKDFFIFPHPKVPEYALRKAKDHARWLKGMQRMRNKLMKNDGGSGNGRSALSSKL